MKINTRLATAAIAFSSFSAIAGSATFAGGSAEFGNNTFATPGTFSGMASSLYDSTSSGLDANNRVNPIPDGTTGSGTSSKAVSNSGKSSDTESPTPESYAMMLAGLGLMGAIVLRRSGKSGG
jgi:hypothetical protein